MTTSIVEFTDVSSYEQFILGSSEYYKLKPTKSLQLLNLSKTHKTTKTRGGLKEKTIPNLYWINYITKIIILFHKNNMQYKK